MALSAPSFLTEGAALLGAAVIAVPLFKKLGLGSVLAFLCAGVVIGPWGLGLFTDPDNIVHVAEFGVVLLLFVIGLELKPSRLWAMKRDIFGLGAAQVFICGVILTGILMLTGRSLSGSVVIGMGLALSSTAFALQLLEERNEIRLPHGHKAFAILLFQDLMIVPMLALVAFLAPFGNEAVGGWEQMAKVVAALVLVVLAELYLINPIFRILAQYGSRETMSAAALLIVIGASLIMQVAGLSMALGAFLAGVLLAESSYRHQLEADIEPFRGLLLALFFMAVGMALDLGFVWTDKWLIIAGVVVLMVLKGVVIFVLVRLFGSSDRDAARVAVTLPQGGEFAFVIFAAAVSNILMTTREASLLTAVVTLTMALTPLGVAVLARLEPRLWPDEPEDDIAEDFSDAKGSVIMIGFGRFGQIAAQMLLAGGVDVTIIDKDPERIRSAAKFGFKVYYGDATRADVLRMAGAAEARILALCIDRQETINRTIELVKAEFPPAQDLCALVRQRPHVAADRARCRLRNPRILRIRHRVRTQRTGSARHLYSPRRRYRAGRSPARRRQAGAAASRRHLWRPRHHAYAEGHAGAAGRARARGRAAQSGSRRSDQLRREAR